jgi:hypothetical protein
VKKIAIDLDAHGHGPIIRSKYMHAPNILGIGHVKII